MLICIPTLGRSTLQVTYHQLPPKIKERTFLIVQAHERDLYPGYRTIVLPESIKSIGETRDWIVRELSHRKVVMLDDDLAFSRRREDVPEKFEPMYVADYTVMFDAIEHMLDHYAHVSVSEREGANRNTGRLRFNTRAMRVLAYRTDVIKEENLWFEPGTFMCDFHMTLELLRRGWPNVVLNGWVHNQAGSNTAGGCSTQRTPQAQHAAARFLEAIHAPFVKVVEKTTKTSWGGGTRYDVRIQWKRALESARAIRVLDSREGEDSPEEGSGLL